jgi:hypothetical protein
MHKFRFKNAILIVAGLALVLVFPQRLKAQGFYEFFRAIPEMDSTGAPLAGANTTFADGSTFRPAGEPTNDLARSDSWAWRAYGDSGILSSLGPGSSAPPSNTKELVTTLRGLKPGTNYAVTVLFWGPGNGLWGIRAGLQYAHEHRTNLWYDVTSPTVMEANYVPWNTIPSVFDEGGRTLFAVSLGNVIATNGEIKIFIHDLPSGNSAIRTWYQGVGVSEITGFASQVIDIGAPGTQFSRGVRGMALADVGLNRGEYYVGVPKSLEVARGSSIRGAATGIAAEIYDWRNRNGEPRPPTLQFLRYSRDFDAELFLGVNLRGLIEPDPAGGNRYYDTNISTVAQLASDWVRYVNHIVPTYRQGDAITNSRDDAILNSLTWSSSFAGDTFDKLLATNEPAVPLIKYWEIGNEPTVGVTAYSVSNSFTLKDSNDFHLRYSAVAQAIKAEDPNVKVGPTIINAEREDDQINAVLFDLSLPVDFIGYHPYERMGDLNDPAEITRHLDSVYSRQLHFFDALKRAVAASGRDADAMEYAATEVNVSYWTSNDTEKEAGMAHALGTVETVFSHARLGLVASHYWIWPTHRWDGTAYPIFKAYEKLRDHMGDTLLSIYAFRDIRVYTTRDSETGEVCVWALNFSGSENTTVHLQLENLPKIQRATLLRLQDKSGITTLDSANLSTEMPGGPAINVDWNSSDMTGDDLSDFNLNLPAATLSLLVIEPGIEKLVPNLFEQGVEKWFSVRFRSIPNASEVRYRLLASDDLASWEIVAESGPNGSEWISLSDDQAINASTSRFFRVESVRQ